ncbi:phosphatase [Kiloniella spongiae]|uniref:Phosphatase n=1 Tax=Kiloniella spongiae TaxID=1489064 RepID=A0A0H2MDL7_9PROT|nr:metallophosphoesterase family protein [Kiloniella spongiae]KLN60316.1 phosphatase [Kiloniella spongiae]
MTIAFISDIHGNFEALKSVLSKLDNLGITDIYCLGDTVGYYSQINECCNELRKRKIPSVMGNHDWYMAGGGFCLRSKSVNDCLEYQKRVIDKENRDWLKALPIHLRVGHIKMVHGGWDNPIDEYLSPNQTYFDRLEGEVFVSGHTHVQSIHKFGNKTYCNPGSVGQPRDGDPRAAFATFTEGIFQLHRVKYDMQKVFDLMKLAGFNDYYYGCLKTGANKLKKLNE